MGMSSDCFKQTFPNLYKPCTQFNYFVFKHRAHQRRSTDQQLSLPLIWDFEYIASQQEESDVMKGVVDAVMQNEDTSTKDPCQ